MNLPSGHFTPAQTKRVMVKFVEKLKSSAINRPGFWNNLHLISGVGGPADRVTRGYVSRQPLPDRELIVRTPITTITSTIGNTMICPKCGTFKKSGRVSCCAPDGAWFKNCGGTGNRNVDHRWIEGVQACKCKCKT